MKSKSKIQSRRMSRRFSQAVDGIYKNIKTSNLIGDKETRIIKNKPSPQRISGKRWTFFEFQVMFKIDRKVFKRPFVWWQNHYVGDFLRNVTNFVLTGFFCVLRSFFLYIWFWPMTVHLTTECVSISQTGSWRRSGLTQQNGDEYRHANKTIDTNYDIV